MANTCRILDNAKTDYISEKESVPGPCLPYAVTKHCMASIEGKAVFLLGGYKDDYTFSKVQINYLDTQGYPASVYEWEPIADMKYTRESHSCGVVIDSSPEMSLTNSTYYFLVAFGGLTESGSFVPSNTTESLEMKVQKGNEALILDSDWKIQGALPFKAEGIASVATPDGKSLIAVGGSTREPELTFHRDILRLQCWNGNCTWSQWHEDKWLHQGRASAVAMIINTDCEM